MRNSNIGKFETKIRKSCKHGLHEYCLLQELSCSGESPVYISDRFGCSLKSIQKVAGRCGIKLPRNNGFTGKEHEIALKMHNEGYYDTDIAAVLHCSKKAVQHWRYRNRIASKYYSFGRRKEGS